MLESEAESKKVTYPPVFEVPESEKRPPDPRRREFDGENRAFMAFQGLFNGCAAGKGQKVEFWGKKKGKFLKAI